MMGRGSRRTYIRARECMPRHAHNHHGTCGWGSRAAAAEMTIDPEAAAPRKQLKEEEEEEAFLQGVWFRRQFEYPHGMFMCTTACMQIGMAVLCGQVNPQRILAAVRRRDGNSMAEATELIDRFMEVADTVHGRIETILFRSSQLNSEIRQPGGGVDSTIRHLSSLSGQGHGPSRMISVNELLTTLRIDAERLGLASHEYMVCESGVHSRLKATKKPAAGCAKRRLAYASEGYRIGLRHVPNCMVVAEGASEGACELASIVLATTNGHTVCGVWQKTADGRGEYALFDSAPGVMRVGLSAEELVEGIGSAIRIPRAAWGSTDQAEPMVETSESDSDPDEDKDDADGRGQHDQLLPNLLPPANRAPGERKAKKKKWKKKRAKIGDDDYTFDRFYCDVTIFFLL